MAHERITIPKKCYHGISLRKNCEKCIMYFINEKKSEIILLKQKLRIIKRQLTVRGTSHE